MPAVGTYGNGGNLAVKGKTTLVGRIFVAAPGGVVASRALVVENIPHILLKITQEGNLGAGLGATIDLQGMVRDSTSLAQKWETYDTFTMPAGGVVSLPFSPNGFTFPFGQVRIRMTSAAASVGQTLVEFVLAATD